MQTQSITRSTHRAGGIVARPRSGWTFFQLTLVLVLIYFVIQAVVCVLVVCWKETHPLRGRADITHLPGGLGSCQVGG